MALRDLSITERVGRAEKDLLELKNSQIFGKDVTSPKVIQRYNSDGTPTQWDVIGSFVSYYSGDVQYRIGGRITYTANNQEYPWATVYAKVMINPSNEILSGDSLGINSYPDMEGVFAGNKTIIFDVSGSSSPLYGSLSTMDATIDRLWVKFYVLANDDGQVKFEFPLGTYGSGTMVAQS